MGHYNENNGRVRYNIFTEINYCKKESSCLQPEIRKARECAEHSEFILYLNGDTILVPEQISFSVS